MSTARTLNRCAFCVLADIPHIWLRTQTARATELMVYLNSCNSIAGRSTRTRFCALFKTSDPAIATRRLEAQTQINSRDPFRMCSSLQYLKILGVNLKINDYKDAVPALNIIS